MKKKGKRLLICIDEVVNTSQMRAFAAALQIFLRHDLPIYLLMTGLAREYLDEYAYDKIWSKLSRKDKEVLYGIAKIKSGSISEIREMLDLSTNEFNPYR